MRVRTKVGKLFMALLAIGPEEDDDLLQEEVSWDESRLASILKEAGQLAQLSEEPVIEAAEPEPPGEEPVVEAAEPVTLEEPVVEAAEPVTLEEPVLQAAEAERSGEKTNEETVEEGGAKSGMDDDIFDVFDEDEVDDTSLQVLLQDLEEVDVDWLLKESQAIAEQLRGNQ
ncbi:MAG: hypothetical protein V3T71_04020 [Dehalococcoidia bacterium]